MIPDNNNRYVIVMKVGPFCGFSLEEIIKIKQVEEQKVGKFYFGYAGVFCHPGKVLRFINLAKQNGASSIKLLFITTPSNFTSELPRSEMISENGVEWSALHPDVLLVGSKFAFVASGISEVEYDLDISQYRSMLGKRKGKFLNEHLRFRADKSCAVYEPNESAPTLMTIKYESELVYPYCVMVK